MGSLESFVTDFLTPLRIGIAFAVIALVFGIVSWVLVYHWNNYIMAKEKIKKVLKIYFSVAGVLLLISLFSVIYYYAL